MFRAPLEGSVTVDSCQKCDQPYKLADSVHAPLILNCSHPCCEECIRSSLCHEGQVVCKMCNIPSTSNSSLDVKFSNLRESFPLSEKIVEEIKNSKKMTPVDEACIAFKPSKKRTPEKSSLSSSLHENACVECGLNLACLLCDKCENSMYCNVCFYKAHSCKFMKDHLPKPISSNGKLSIEKKHGFVKQLKENYPKLLKKKEKFDASIKMLQNQGLIDEAKSSGMDVEKVRDDLKQFFMFCQNSIKSIEIKVMNEFESVAGALDSSRAKCLKDLNRWHAEIIELCKLIYSIGNSKCYTEDLELWLKKSNDLLEKPDTFRTTRPVVSSKTVEIPSNEWCKKLENQLNFDFGQGGEIVLVNSLDSYEIDACETLDGKSCKRKDSAESVTETPVVVTRSFANSSFVAFDRHACQSWQRRPSRTESVQFPLRPSVEHIGGYHRSGSIGELDHNPNQSRFNMNGAAMQIKGPSLSHCGVGPSPKNNYDRKNPIMRANIGRQVRFREGWIGAVTISNIVTPSYFYVQLDTCAATLEKYKKFFSAAVNVSPISKDDVKIGRLYLAQCSDNNWYRVRVTQIVPSLLDDSIPVNQIDTGKTETVSIARLRRIDEVMKNAALDPELAIQCSIFDCYPVGSTWTDEDNELFKSALKDKPVVMIVKKVQSNKLEVDITWSEKGMSSSIRDYMIGMKKACIADLKDRQNVGAVSDDCRYFRDKQFTPSSWVEVDVTVILAPDHFYVKRIDRDNEKKYNNMNIQLDAFYKSKANYWAFTITQARLNVGTPVAAQYTADNVWYRAEVLNVIPQSKKIEVRYVDFGNTEHLPFARVRLLAHEFIRFTAQAIKCSLNGIKPLCGTAYKSAATNYFMQNVKDKKLKMVVDDVKESELIVTLFRIDDNEDICLNALLVKEQFAKKYGNVLSEATFPKKVSPKLSGDEENRASVVDTRKEEIQSDIDGVDGDENGTDISSSEEVTPDDEKCNTQLERFEVEIALFVNPNLFYVSSKKHLPGILDMVNEMTKFYRDEKNNKDLLIKSVEVGERYAAYVESDLKWYRARVTGVEENHKIIVFLKDIAREEIVELKDLRTLCPEFRKPFDGTIACHLVDIEERLDWSENLCETLANSLTNYHSVFIAKHTKVEDKKTTPVELWCKRVTCQGPFEPATEEWSNFNVLLAKTLKEEASEIDSTSIQSGIGQKIVMNNLHEMKRARPVETVTKWLQDNDVEGAVKGVEYSDIVANGGIPPEHLYSSKKSSTSLKNEVILEEGREAHEASVRDWLPAEPLSVTEFEGMPTYVDDDFNIFFQLSGKQKKVLDMISAALQSRYASTSPLPIDMNWFPGQICIAWFFVDKKWYRARVLKVEDDSAVVEYVDFGNTEKVSLVHLRKDVTLLNIPIQCHKLPIRSDCVSTSDGKWPVKVLEFVHTNILERKCSCKLRKENNENFYRIEKFFIDEVSIELFELLESLNYAEFKPMPVASNDEIDSDSSSSIAGVDSVSNLDLSDLLQIPGISNVIIDPFTIPQNPTEYEVKIPWFDVPANLSIVTVEVTEILQLDEIVVHIVDTHDEDVNKVRNSFLEMNEELQKKGGEQPLIGSPSFGRMCCTKFEDGLWYRVKIIDHCIDNEEVPILYVDYGNSSRANLNALHEMKRSWFDVPIQSVRCRLLDYDLPNNHEQALEKLLSLLNNKYEAVLETTEKPQWFKIKLYFK